MRFLFLSVLLRFVFFGTKERIGETMPFFFGLEAVKSSLRQKKNERKQKKSTQTF